MNSDRADGIGSFDRSMLFRIGALALFTAAFSLAVRGAVSGELKAEFFDPINAAESGVMISTVLGTAFSGFALTLFLTAAFVDHIGMRRLALISATCLSIGSLLLIAAKPIAIASGGLESAYSILVVAMLLTGIGWGCAESFTNPMTASLYPEDKTHRLNVLHAWWPAGLVIGGLAGVLVGRAGLDWQWALALTPVPAVIFGLMAWKQDFPVTQAKLMKVSFGDTILEAFRRPSFFIWFGMMILTAASELAPGQWVQIALTRVVGMEGILLLVYISAIMFVGRHFAGAVERRLSATGLLWMSSLLAAIGLYLLGIADSPPTALLAATFWGLGVCFMWPTMLAQAAERYPRGGAWTIGLLGSAGALSIQFVLPAVGAVYDRAKLAAAGGEASFAAVAPDSERMISILAYAAKQSFHTIAIFPLVLVLAFGGLWLAERKRKPIDALTG